MGITSRCVLQLYLLTNKISNQVTLTLPQFKPNKKWSVPSAPKIKPGGPVVVPSKSSATATTSTTVKEADPKRKAIEKPKPTGKLDWSNAKTKEQKAAENKEKKFDDAKVKKEEQEKKAKRDEEMRVKKEEAKKKKEQMAKERERETVKMEVSKDDHKKVRLSLSFWSLLCITEILLLVSAPEHSSLTLIPTQNLSPRHDNPRNQ